MRIDKRERHTRLEMGLSLKLCLIMTMFIKGFELRTYHKSTCTLTDTQFYKLLSEAPVYFYKLCIDLRLWVFAAPDTTLPVLARPVGCKV